MKGPEKGPTVPDEPDEFRSGSPDVIDSEQYDEPQNTPVFNVMDLPLNDYDDDRYTSAGEVL